MLAGLAVLAVVAILTHASWLTAPFVRRPSDMPRKTWYSTEDVARITGMSVSWVRTAITERRLKAVAWEIGARRTYRVRSEWLQEFLDTYRRGPDDL